MPEFAVYSGYEMDRKTFRMFVNALPGADDMFYRPKKRRNFLHYVLAFNSWKNRLPTKQRRYVPSLRLRYASDEPTNPEEEVITHVFFLFRFVDYKADSQLTEGHPDNIPISEETPADQARFDSLIRLMKDRGGTLERDMVTFTFMKELHPDVDWRSF